jgi:hypothetical protein
MTRSQGELNQKMQRELPGPQAVVKWNETMRNTTWQHADASRDGGKAARNDLQKQQPYGIMNLTK